ncbi:MAG: archaeosine biosynthesis radical SAM protein RaSEA, partial [Candidatus Aminicenantes bacterium]
MKKIIGTNIEKWLGGLENTPFSGEKSQYYKYISDLQGSLHQQIPEENYSTAKVPVPTEIREENFKGKNYKRAVMYLMSNGCEWALKDGNGCTMCGHLAKQTRRTGKISAQEFYHQFISEFKTIDFNQYPLLNLYNNGSFLNDNEMPEAAMKKILETINQDSAIKMLVLETRPEFVTQKKIKEIKRLVPGKHVEIAMGLEIKDDFYRRVCVNKGFILNQYARAAEIITKELHLRTYVLLKPPFLTEKEAVDHAVETINYAFAAGSHTVSLEACTVQDYTLVKYLADQNLYRTPWLWSILEVVKSTAPPGKPVIGLFQFFPSPKVVPYNCDKCSNSVMEAIRQYNRTLNTNAFDQLTCVCKKEW